MYNQLFRKKNYNQFILNRKNIKLITILKMLLSVVLHLELFGSYLYMFMISYLRLSYLELFEIEDEVMRLFYTL
jgi:hypothetical protein